MTTDTDTIAQQLAEARTAAWQTLYEFALQSAEQPEGQMSIAAQRRQIDVETARCRVEATAALGRYARGCELQGRIAEHRRDCGNCARDREFASLDAGISCNRQPELQTEWQAWVQEAT